MPLTLMQIVNGENKFKRNTHDWSIDKPYKADFEKYLNYIIDL